MILKYMVLLSIRYKELGYENFPLLSSGLVGTLHTNMGGGAI